MNTLTLTAVLLVHGVLCACAGAAVARARTRRRAGTSNAGLLDPTILTAMRALRDNHPGEYIELHTAETGPPSLSWTVTSLRSLSPGGTPDGCCP